MNGVQKTEQAIASGNFDPVRRFRVYQMVNSPAHIAAGADWMLYFSSDDRADAEEMANEKSMTGLYFTFIYDGKMKQERSEAA